MSERILKWVATNLTDLHAEPSFLSELLTQVTNGVALEVLEERDKWCRVRQMDGYEGWAYKPYLCDSPPGEATHIAHITMSLFREPESGRTVGKIPIGTALRLVEQGPRHWVRLRVCAGSLISEGWTNDLFLRDLSAFPLKPAAARNEIVDVARGLTGAYYLWGGCTDWGIDCSGLAQLCHRLAGHAIPRDARLQFPVGRAVEAPFEPGDLLFFHGESDTNRITHVGISTGGWNIIHSSRTRNGVYEEDVQSNENLRTNFAGARSFLK